MNEHKAPLISIIIPVYNVLQYLDECLQSVLAQTYSNLEIILVDDGSTDGSGERCDAYAQSDDRIRVIHQENQGLGMSRNVGTGVSTGQYILYVDSDDAVAAQLVEILWNMIKDRPGYISSCASCFFTEVEEPQYTLSYDNIQLFSPKEAIEKIMYQEAGIETHAWGRLFPKDLIEREAVLFPDTYYEDLPTIYRLIQKSAGLVHNCGAGYGYRQRSTSIMSSSYSAKKGRDILEVCSGLAKAYEQASPAEKKMVRCRCFSAVSNVFVQIPRGKQYAKDEQLLWRAMKQYRKGVCWDPKARIKNRLGALATYLGKDAFRGLYRYCKS